MHFWMDTLMSFRMHLGLQLLPHHFALCTMNKYIWQILFLCSYGALFIWIILDVSSQICPDSVSSFVYIHCIFGRNILNYPLWVLPVYESIYVGDYMSYPLWILPVYESIYVGDYMSFLRNFLSEKFDVWTMHIFTNLVTCVFISAKS